MKLTPSSIRALKLRNVREKTFFDDDLPGFGVRVRDGGSQTFVVQYKFGPTHRRLTLGPVSGLDLGKAKATAKDLLAAVRLGRDPAGERLEAKAQAAETFGALLLRYLDRQQRKLKPRSYIETERHLLVGAKPLHPYAVKKIDRRTVATRLAAVAESNGPGAANQLRAALSTYFTWLARESFVEVNPVTNTNREPTNGARTRVLTDSELRAIWHAVGDDRYGSIVKLLMLTGARREEIGGLQWSEVDLDNALIVLPAERTKNRRPHEIPLTPMALAILQAQPHGKDFVFAGVGRAAFTGWSKSKAELDACLGALPEWRVHDMRRSLSTTMHERLGVPPHIVEAILGHISGHKSGVAGTYNLARYSVEKRRALEQWADHLARVVANA
jgi:integrase